MKITITIDEDLKKVMEKPVDEIDEEDEDVIEDAKEKLPRNVVKLPKDETMMEPGQNAKPFVHTVKKGETLKDIAEKYSVSYGELSQHLMNTEGTTSIHAGQVIEIPRHFQDLTKAM
jgi:LysM repeat protein